MGKKRAGGVRVKQLGPKGGGPKNPMDLMPTMQDFAIQPEDQIHLPPTPDRSYSIVWPIQETFTMKTDTGFQIIYPSYLDANKTVKLGRRVSLDLAVPQPTVSDISLALQSMKIRHVLQPYKGYSRDPTTLWENPGRVVVDMTQPPSKSALLRSLCERIPHIPERQGRIQAEAAAAAQQEQKRMQEEQEKEKQAAAAAKKPATTTTLSKKKGKKGRKK